MSTLDPELSTPTPTLFAFEITNVLILLYVAILYSNAYVEMIVIQVM
jgi:hypothetical protein